MTWTEIHKKFLRLKDFTGAEKSSSYVMNVYFDQEGLVNVELGCYDISDWPRRLHMGPYTTEEEAKVATWQRVIEAYHVLLNERDELVERLTEELKGSQIVLPPSQDNHDLWFQVLELFFGDDPTNPVGSGPKS